MTEEEKEDKELRDYQKEIDKEEAAKKLVDEYKSLLPLMLYPPINLNKNFELFREDFLKALNDVSAEIPGDSTIMKKLSPKWRSEIEEAKSFYKDGKVEPIDATLKYMKINKKLTYMDFANKEIFR